MIDVKKIRKEFPIYDNNKKLIYLDSAASALKVKRAIDATTKYYNKYGVNVHRGTYNLTYEATKLYENARTIISKFINAKETEIVFTKGATQALNIVANGYTNKLNSNDEIIVSELEHHSSILPWLNVANKTGAKLVYVPLTKEGKITVENFISVVSNKTRIVALTLASNALGYITPIKDIIKYLRANTNAHITVDAAQAAPHMAIDVKDMDCDYLAFSGHKMYGPSGVGVLYGKEALLNCLDPFEFGGEMVLTFDKDKVEYKSSPLKFEAGTPVISGAIGLASALDFITEIGYENIQIHINKLHQYVLSKLKDEEGIFIYNRNAELGIVTFNVDNIHPHDVASFLDQHQIAIRAGHHCAQLVTKFLGVTATLRASFNIYNDISDCDIFIKTLIDARDFFKKF